MKYKVSPIVIPTDEPFRHDALARKAGVSALATLVQNLDGPFVIAIDSPWGTGKTTFCRLLQVVLEGQNLSTVYFSAWETDFSSDPLVAFLGEIARLNEEKLGKGREFSDQFDKVKRIGTVLAKKALVAGGKLATAGVLNLDEIAEETVAEFVADSIDDVVEAYSAEKSLIERFHVELKSAIDKIAETGGIPKLVIFVDDLDRCRPNYAIELLERIKHLFNIQNVIFVLSLDKRQLHVSLGAVYGRSIDASEYLRRFLDLEYMLPPPNAEAFTESLFSRFGFDEFFRISTHRRANEERNDLKETFTDLSDVFDLSLRAREQCFTRIRVAMSTTPPNYYIFPLFLTVLVILRTVNPALYQKYTMGIGTAKDVLTYIKQFDKGQKFLNERSGSVVEAYLLAAKSQRHDPSVELMSYQNLAKTPDNAEGAHAKEIVELVGSINSHERVPDIRYVLSKIEISFQFK